MSKQTDKNKKVYLRITIQQMDDEQSLIRWSKNHWSEKYYGNDNIDLIRDNVTNQIVLCFENQPRPIR